MTLLESNGDKMPLISLLENVGNEVVSIQRGHIAKGRRAGFLANSGLEDLFFSYIVCFCFICFVLFRGF